MTDHGDTPFESSPVSRRQFVRLSAAAGGTLLLPGTGAAQDISSEKFSATYEFVVNHTPTSEPVQTLVRLDDLSGILQLRELDLSLRTTDEPELAAYLEPTPNQVRQILEIGAVTEFLFSPGANPFWRIDNYDDRVFPPVEESTGFIAFEEMVQGMEYLSERHSDRLRLESIGESVGRYNLDTHEIESHDIWVFELTNGVGDADSFEDKEKLLIFNQDSDERQGPEAMFRFIEDILIGNEPETAALLDEMAFVFMIANPDGWVSKYTQYYSGEEVTEDRLVRVNQFRTLLPTGADPNRSYPPPGYINPEYYPAEPAGSDLVDDVEGVDDDVPDYISDTVPGELDIAEYFRTRDYQNLNYGLDLHGMGAADAFLEGFPLNGNYDYADVQDLYRLQQRVEAAIDESDLQDRITDSALQEIFEDLNEQMRDGDQDESLPVPEQDFRYGTLFDILGYSTSGDTISWMSAAETNGGLGDIKTFATETVYSTGEYIPELVEAWVVANTTLMRATANHVVQSVEAGVQTDGASTAFVTSEALARSSDTLPFTGDGESNATAYESRSASWTLPPADGDRSASSGRTTVEVPSAGSELVVAAPADSSVELDLVAPDGTVARSRTFRRQDAGFGARRPTMTAAVESSGTWTVRARNLHDDPREVEVSVGLLQSEGDSPDPEEVLGYTQREYAVTPFQFFEDYGSYITDAGELAGMDVEAVENGALVENGSPAVENAVVIHSQGIDSAAYVAALDDYVASGGNLVLTDEGVHLLAAMTNELARPIAEQDVTDHTLFTAFLGERNEDHPLLAGTEPSQLEVGKWVPLGYSLDLDCPMTLVDPAAFEQAGGTVAATTAGEYKEIDPGVSAGSMTRPDSQTGIHVIGGALPPATQDHLHPFGLNEYLLSQLGMMLVSNALGYETTVSVGADGGGN